MLAYIRISGSILVAFALTAVDPIVLGARQQELTSNGQAQAAGQKAKIKPPAPSPVMGPVKWLPDPVESSLRSSQTPPHCTEIQTVKGRTVSAVPVQQSLLDCWLEAYPVIAQHIRWEVGNTQYLAWKDWPEWRKAALRDAFRNALLWHENGLAGYPGPTFNEPIANEEAPYFDQQPFVRTVLDENAQAWPLYLAITGHVLASEVVGFVPWSIRDMGSEGLSLLLSGPDQFYLDKNDNTWYDTIYPGYGVWGSSTPAHPAYTYKFLVDNDLIGATQTETIERVMDWARWNLRHFNGAWNWDNVFHTWGYRGNVPVARVIEGTVLTHPYYVDGDHPYSKEPHHWTAGCYGTVDFLANLLRLANIPVKVLSEQVHLAGHYTAYFPTIQRYLTHGDDPYDQLAKGFDPFPARQMLIDQSMFDAWFPDVPMQQQVANVGRRPVELSIFFPSRYLLDAYCRDQANLKSHADGQVAALYVKLFTVQQLESMLLWQRLDKAAQQHGCAM
jgi:hypothetical protein